MTLIWRDAVINGIQRLTETKNSKIFTRQELIDQQLPLIVQEVGSTGETPSQTLSRILQELRDDDLLDFMSHQRGMYYSLLDEINIEHEDLPSQIIDTAIKENKLRFADTQIGEKVVEVRQRIGQQRLRALTLENYHYQCALCNTDNTEFLVAAHLARWADFPDGRGDLSNIVCLCRFHDPLVEYGYISFSDDLQILKKNTQNQMIDMVLKETTKFKQPIRFLPDSKFLALHRKRTGFG
nr:hypothetical protein [uncultured Hyphomonas sp.]